MDITLAYRSLPPVSVDKLQFPFGVWTEEPDFDAWSDRNYICAIRRNSLGSLCGYVALPLDHPLVIRQFPVQVTASINSLDVHGGVTFNEKIDGFYWIGFDCAHLGDYVPALDYGGSYRDFDYVKSQISSVVDQLIEISSVKVSTDHKLVIFNTAATWSSKVNFVDGNNVVLGFDTDQSCCEDADWFIADEVIPRCLERTWTPEEIFGYYFDTSFFQEISGEDQFDAGGMVVFRITNGIDEKFIHLYNCHNGYYSHGFEFEVNGEKIKNDSI